MHLAEACSVYLGQPLDERLKLDRLALPQDGPAFMHLVVKNEPSSCAQRCTV